MYHRTHSAFSQSSHSILIRTLHRLDSDAVRPERPLPSITSFGGGDSDMSPGIPAPNPQNVTGRSGMTDVIEAGPWGQCSSACERIFCNVPCEMVGLGGA